MAKPLKKHLIVFLEKLLNVTLVDQKVHTFFETFEGLTLR